MKNFPIEWIIMIMILFRCIPAHSESLSEDKINEPCNSKVIELPEHLYLAVEQITVADNKIYVNIYNEIYETSTLFSDEKGLYIQTINSKCTGECGWFYWQCRRCGFCNLYELECKVCNASKAYYKCN